MNYNNSMPIHPADSYQNLNGNFTFLILLEERVVIMNEDSDTVTLDFD